jgi:hypothetical protein
MLQRILKIGNTIVNIDLQNIPGPSEKYFVQQ